MKEVEKAARRNRLGDTRVGCFWKLRGEARDQRSHQPPPRVNQLRNTILVVAVLNVRPWRWMCFVWHRPTGRRVSSNGHKNHASAESERLAGLGELMIVVFVVRCTRSIYHIDEPRGNCAADPNTLNPYHKVV